MIESLNVLVERLREELQQYGEMLALLDQQQQQVVSRHTGDLLATAAAVNEQGAVIQSARERREEARRGLASFLGRSEEAPFVELVTLVNPSYRPLLEALVTENNQLLVRVHQRARQNHMLLHRSLDLLQRLISSLSPSGPPVYDGAGHLLGAALLGRSRYEAVG